MDQASKNNSKPFLLKLLQICTFKTALKCVEWNGGKDKPFQKSNQNIS